MTDMFELLEAAAKSAKIQGRELELPSLDTDDDTMLKMLHDQMRSNEVLVLVCVKEVIEPGEKIWNPGHPYFKFPKSFFDHTGQEAINDHMVLVFPTSDNIGRLRRNASIQGGVLQVFAITVEIMKSMIIDNPVIRYIIPSERLESWGLKCL